MEDVSKKILLVGGHMTPAFAVLDELDEREYKNIVWVGQKYSQVGDQNVSSEYKAVTNRNIPFIELQSGKLFRIWNQKTFNKALKSLFRIPKGLWQAYQIIKKEKPDLIMCFGGFLAVPIAIAGYLQKIPVTTHEQTLAVGLANRIISRFASKTFVSFPQNVKELKNRKNVILTGNPIRKAIFESKSQSINFYNNQKIIYITGGNQGANDINANLLKILPALLHDFNVVHQTGNSSITLDYEKSIAFKASLPQELADRYIVKDYVYEYEIGEVFDKASLVISRSGLNTCLELLALNKLCILLPLDKTSGGEQLKNAELLKRVGLAEIIEYENLTPEILNKTIYHVAELASLGKNLQGTTFEDTIAKSRQYVKPNAAEAIVSNSLKLIK